jgi:nascent polypeptide-associated complex subunit alpha
MPKLPKELQKKKKMQQSRVKGPSGSGKGKGGASRAMRRKLQSQGIDNMENIESTAVIIKCIDKEIIIENPQVVRLKQQGVTIHQIIGEPVERELTYGEEEIINETIEEPIDEKKEEEILEEDISDLTINQQDINLVAAQANVSEQKAKKALEDADGDLARAILNLQSKN